MRWFLSSTFRFVGTSASGLQGSTQFRFVALYRIMRSERFGKEIVISDHARDRMVERNIELALLSELIETGDLSYQDDRSLFIFKRFAGRHDNLVCAAAVEEDSLVIKTVMVNWNLRDAI